MQKYYALLFARLVFAYLDLLSEFYNDKIAQKETRILTCCNIALFLFSYK